MHSISKHFGGAAALRDVDFDLRAGEVHALVGMNGAGKSTLVNVISGSIVPNEGEMYIDGAEVHSLTPRKAREHGIATVPQKRNLVDSLTVGENLLIGRLPKRGGAIDWKRVHEQARVLLGEIGLDIDPRILAGNLTSAEQTLVEIARENHQGHILILDEPTATLGGAAAERVRDLVKLLRSKGRAIIYISHHLDEILELADRVTIMRDGRKRLTVPRSELDVPTLVRAMVGSDVVQTRPDRADRALGEERIALEDLSSGRRLQRLNVRVRGGEIVAVLGPAGDGQAVLFGALAGRSIPDSGKLEIDGQVVPFGSVKKSLRSGLRCITGNRIANGLVGGLSVDENILMARDRKERRSFVNWQDLHRRARELRQAWGVKTIGADPAVAMLSGGNQQKVLLAKWLADKPDAIFLEEPTNGVDIAAKEDIHREIDQLAEGGSAVLLSSSDVHEVLRLADRIIVVNGGRIVAERNAESVTRDELVALTIGEPARA
ncbi:sugar ABC transporter ATP-binding protein [Gulosibacter molinativorax]|uniref:Sugar ABC transporter ATP-binding protein n=2 Tax=Gulosibacter molinativorax TaxID=256821 RepID=A0ABT7C9Z2_9MICO|nr:sugar ABC transporter ATP-binding protein [Gulosibacter molinativorax]